MACPSWREQVLARAGLGASIVTSKAERVYPARARVRAPFRARLQAPLQAPL